MGQRNIDSTNNYRSTRIHTNPYLECNLKKLSGSDNVGTLQRSVLLGTANILRKVLSNKD